MKLICLGSSSRGNGYLLANENESLVIEAGVSLKEVTRALNHNVLDIVGCIYTHSHKDHSKYVDEFIRSGIPVLSPDYPKLAKPTVKFGNFMVTPFDLIHDVKIYGFHIFHPECGNVLFVTDTESIPYRFSNLNQIIVEANYDDDIVYDNMMNGKMNVYLQNRVESSHLSIQKTLEFFSENDLSGVQNIVLIHLSSGSSNANQFRDRAERATGKPVTIADKGVIIDFNLNPF